MNTDPRTLAVVVLAFVAGPALAATTFHVAPGKGSMSGNGSASRPWSTLSEVVSSGRIRDVRPGDTILLGTGDHGDVRLSGDNAEPIVVAAARGRRLASPASRSTRARGGPCAVSPSAPRPVRPTAARS